MSRRCITNHGFNSDAAYFDIAAEQCKDPADRRHLKEVAKTYRSLAKNGHGAQPVRSRRDHWRNRAEECRTLSDQFQNPTCRAQLQRLADTYEMMVKSCEPAQEW